MDKKKMIIIAIIAIALILIIYFASKKVTEIVQEKEQTKTGSLFTDEEIVEGINKSLHKFGIGINEATIIELIHGIQSKEDYKRVSALYMKKYKISLISDLSNAVKDGLVSQYFVSADFLPKINKYLATLK